MSDTSSEKPLDPELNDDELAKEIEEKCWDAFLAFDKEGSG